MVNEQKKVLIKALKNYGVDKQLLICEEEAAELIQAITKMQRYPDDLNRRDNLIEEMADVLICLEYLKLIYKIDKYIDKLNKIIPKMCLDFLNNNTTKIVEEHNRKIISLKDYLNKL